jgi:flagellar FliJ protein
MARFQFRLATLLRLHEATRDQRRGQLAEAFRAEEALRNRLSELEYDLLELKRQYRQTVSAGPLDVDRLIDAQRYELLLMAEQQSVGQQTQTLAVEIDKRREALVAADREVRVLEKLRETQAERHRVDEEQREVKQLDEVASRRFGPEEVDR